jgi:hypothetical protein
MMGAAQVWFFVLVCISGPTCEPGHELSAAKAGDDYDAAFSESSCAEYAKQIAKAMYVKEGDRYGFKCLTVDYDPPDLTGKGEKK